jgi:DNA-binding NarL/FixJ family response regulator
MADTPPRVVIYDVAVLQCELLAKGLTTLSSGFDTVCVNDSESLFRCLSSASNWIVIISDVNPHSDSLAIARNLYKLFPGIIFIVMIQAGRQDRMIEAFKAGAKGVISSDTTLPQLAKCISHVAQGEVWAGRHDLSAVLDVLVGSTTQVVDADGKKLLTPREEEVASLVAEGLSNRDISNALRISESTVKNYIFHIFDKLGVSNRVELTRYLTQAS